MKKYFASIALILLAQQLMAFNFFNQLCAFNSNWKKYEGRLPESSSRIFISDKEYIQAHINSVLEILNSNPVAHLTVAQYHSRKQLIALLDGYCMAGRFPINYYRNERIPVFIDQNNTHCAVGYLLQQTGYEGLAISIAAKNNYAWVKEITDTTLITWQQSSGLSLEELKLIQGAYDFYMPNAFVLPNKYEVPQKPDCITAYFGKKKKATFIWCRGEGKDAVLNGRWEQNFAPGIPWIVGYFTNGKRSGQWMEYYQGTNILCRTENWRDNKLNGIRKRFDKAGNLIEEILFKDGNAVTKTNYDLGQALTWVRKPIDLASVWTEVYTTGGSLIAAGHETIYNPGNLLWFQNIELTALNSAAISSRETVLNLSNTNAAIPRRIRAFTKPTLFNQLPLVEYKKDGDWIYFKDCPATNETHNYSVNVKEMLLRNYTHFGKIIFQSIEQFSDLKINTGYDSVKVIYSKNMLQDFYGYGVVDYTHLKINYYHFAVNNMQAAFSYRQNSVTVLPMVKETGQYNKANKKIGTWKHYTIHGSLYKLENFILPQGEEDEKNEMLRSFQPNPAWREDGAAIKWKIKKDG